MPLDLATLDVPDARLVQIGLKDLGFYGGTTRGVPGPLTKAAYGRYRGGTSTPPPVEPGPALTYPVSVQREIEFDGPIGIRTRGLKARRVQEWVSIHGVRTAVDDDFGQATQRAVRRFQEIRGLDPTGTVDEATWEALVAPMTRVLAPIAATPTLSGTVLALATRHLAEHPVEVGGANRGPWVRLYMKGNQGAAWPWCAGFVTFVLSQAAQIHGATSPVPGSFSCDTLAAQAKARSRFIRETDLAREPGLWSEAGLGACSVFLVRRTSTDWTHTGFAFDYEGRTFDTVEGNTNDEGSREGFEVCRRIRSRGSMDFVRLTDAG